MLHRSESLGTAKEARPATCVPDEDNPSWQRPRAPEIAVFTVSGGVVRGETLFATGAEQFEWQAEEGHYAGSRFHCYSRPA